MMIREACHPRA